MPVIGNRKSKDLGKSYANNSMSNLASKFLETAKDILEESGSDIFYQPTKAMMLESSNRTMQDFFVENSADTSNMTTEEYDDHIEMMTEQYLNDRDAVLEYANIGSYNPVIGMTFPMHKNILMNNIFDKGAIPKLVAREPKFTVSMENRILVTPDGKEIDMWKNQKDITPAIDATAPFVEVEVSLPEYGETDILDEIDASSLDNLSIETYISQVQVDVKGAEKWFDVNLQFTPNYGEYERSLIEAVHIKPEGEDEDVIEDVISATMHKNTFQISALRGKVKKVKIKARKDTSNGLLQTCSVKWTSKTDIVEIPSAIPINTTVSPDEVKDLGALYNVNQLSKIMELFKIVLENHKDDTIKAKLDESFLTMPESNKIQGKFDFAPRDGYALDHVEWRHKTFFDALDTYVTELLQVLGDPNMTVSIFGRPDTVRKITPTEYSYQTPDNIGAVELDFTKTVVTSDKRVYNFVSSQKLKDSTELIIVLCPRNTNRIVYRIYDYQMYFSNEIRNASNPTLPAIHAYERWKFKDYQPVQGRIQILNPTGLK